MAKAMHDDFFCSFCGKRKNEVRKLVSGPRVFICNECIVRCRDVLGPRPPRPAADERESSARTTMDEMPSEVPPDGEGATPEKKPPDDRHCSFCGKAKNDVDQLVNGPTGYICNE